MPSSTELSPAITSTLVIVNGALAYLVNYPPTIWHSEPAPMPSNPTGTPNG